MRARVSVFFLSSVAARPPRLEIGWAVFDKPWTTRSRGLDPCPESMVNRLARSRTGCGQSTLEAPHRVITGADVELCLLAEEEGFEPSTGFKHQ